MANKNPTFTVLALVRSGSGQGRDAKEVTAWIPIGALWETAEKDLQELVKLLNRKTELSTQLEAAEEHVDEMLTRLTTFLSDALAERDEALGLVWGAKDSQPAVRAFDLEAFESKIEKKQKKQP